jgi:hypothetical protein
MRLGLATPVVVGLPGMTGAWGATASPDGFEVVLATHEPLDPSHEPVRVREHLHALHEAGATAVACSVRANSAAHYVDQLSALRDLVKDEEGIAS